uniref:Uncharacterized protein n=1 Tax=Arundo donax TaxID=35708 RepID=A0A0A9E290_ARUDO
MFSYLSYCQTVPLCPAILFFPRSGRAAGIGAPPGRSPRRYAPAGSGIRRGPMSGPLRKRRSGGRQARWRGRKRKKASAAVEQPPAARAAMGDGLIDRPHRSLGRV